MSTEYAQIKTECEMLREHVKDECQKKQIAESSVKMLCDEKGLIIILESSTVFMFMLLCVDSKIIYVQSTIVRAILILRYIVIR